MELTEEVFIEFDKLFSDRFSNGFGHWNAPINFDLAFEKLQERSQDNLHSVISHDSEMVGRSRSNGFSYVFDYVTVFCPFTNEFVEVRNNVSERHYKVTCKCGGILPQKDYKADNWMRNFK